MVSRRNRRFFKGMPSTWGRDVDRETEAQAAQDSFYYWWWAFLAESVDYRRAVTGRKEEPYASLAADFGRLGSDFEVWWFERGREIFAEPVAVPRVRRLEHEEVANYEGINPKLVIEIPLAIRRQTILRQVNKLLDQCQAAGVKQVYLITPPIYDATTKPGEFNYDSVMTAYAGWEMQLKRPGLTVIDLHAAMRKARDARTEVFSRDRIHPGDDGHLLMARTILAGAGVATTDVAAKDAMADPLFKAVDQLRKYRAAKWMAHVGYTRERVVAPTPLGDAEEQVAKLQAKVDELRRAK